nr:unnamed protein product [Spirometra erinaceieuropaei]
MATSLQLLTNTTDKNDAKRTPRKPPPSNYASVMRPWRTRTRNNGTGEQQWRLQQQSTRSKPKDRFSSSRSLWTTSTPNSFQLAHSVEGHSARESASSDISGLFTPNQQFHLLPPQTPPSPSLQHLYGGDHQHLHHPCHNPSMTTTTTLPTPGEENAPMPG